MSRAFIVGGLAIASLAFACVDLFHSTNFETLCDQDASAKGCSTPEAGPIDANVPTMHYDSCSLSSSSVQALSQKVCLWMGACLGPIGDSAYGPCTLQAALAYDCKANPNLRPLGERDLFWSCLAKSGNGPKSCAEVEACVYTSVVKQECATVATGSFRGCDRNGSRVECQAGQKFPAAVEPCVMSGRHCVPAVGGTDAFCVSTTTTTTPPTAPGCKGTSAQIVGKTDNTTIDKGVDCAFEGNGRCAGTTTPVCEGAGDASTACSTASGSITCIGAVAQTCATSRTVSIDCDALDSDCDSTNASAAVLESACVPRGDAGTACTEGTDSCASDGTLNSCVLGRPVSVKCTTAGFGPCVLHPHGAYCTAP